ncbi:hypothetical protein Q3G72_025953 [Acer saccharum]|nr:hypothetical protein Q3G72_025953 [Acer saccharum]
MYGRCQSALALSGGVMGGHSYSSSSSSSSSDDGETRTSSDTSYDPYYSTSETETCRCTCSCCGGVYVSGRHRSRMNVSDPPRPIPTLLDFLGLPLLLIVALMMTALITTFIEAVVRLLRVDCGKLLADAVESSSVYKIQVGLSVTGSSLQSDFNRIATTADTSGSSGWKYILEG